MEALGRLFDISAGTINVDVNTSGATGKRVSMRTASACSIVAVLPSTGGTEDLVFTLKQYTAASGGSTANLAICDHYYIKAASTLAGTETWTRVTNNGGTKTQTVTVSGATYGGSQCIVVIPVDAAQLSDTYAYVGMDTADPGSTARVISVLYFLHDLEVQRKPANLAAALA